MTTVGTAEALWRQCYGCPDPDFDVDAFLADCDWDVSPVFRRGEVRLPRTEPEGCRGSGFNLKLSAAGFHALDAQVRDVVAFLATQADEVRRLVAFPGVSTVVIDFGIARRDVVAQSDRFPAELVRLAGACGVALELSQYPIDKATADQ